MKLKFHNSDHTYTSLQANSTVDLHCNNFYDFVLTDEDQLMAIHDITSRVLNWLCKEVDNFLDSSMINHFNHFSIMNLHLCQLITQAIPISWTFYFNNLNCNYTHIYKSCVDLSSGHSMIMLNISTKVGYLKNGRIKHYTIVIRESIPHINK